MSMNRANNFSPARVALFVGALILSGSDSALFNTRTAFVQRPARSGEPLGRRMSILCVPCLRLSALASMSLTLVLLTAARKGALYGQHSDLAHRMEIHDAGPVC